MKLAGDAAKMSDSEMIEFFNGTKKWYKKGFPTNDRYLHRTDGPAIIYPDDGGFKWYNDGKLHRIGGPAVEFDDGQKEWWVNGLLHREDGPALIVDGGSYYVWYLHGKKHRLDGPAFENKLSFSNIIQKQWYINDEYITDSEEEFKRYLKLKAFI